MKTSCAGQSRPAREMPRSFHRKTSKKFLQRVSRTITAASWNRGVESMEATTAMPTQRETTLVRVDRDIAEALAQKAAACGMTRQGFLRQLLTVALATMGDQD